MQEGTARLCSTHLSALSGGTTTTTIHGAPLVTHLCSVWLRLHGQGGRGGDSGRLKGDSGEGAEGVARLGSTHLSSSTTAIVHGAPLVVHGGVLCLVMHLCSV